LDRITLLATHALASAIFGFVLIEHGGVDVGVGALSGAVLFLFLRYLHDTLSLARDRREIEEDLSAMRSAAVSLRGSLDDTKRSVGEITAALTKRADSYERKLASELKAIERALVARPSPGSGFGSGSPKVNPGPVSRARSMSDQAMLDLIRTSLNENRVDLYLQPIVSLPQRRIRFYEALTRLRSSDGSIVMPAHFMTVAAPAGLMPVIDNLLFLRCVQLVRRLSHRNRDIAVFCNISEQTLTDAEFFPQFLEFLRANRDVSGQIVFELAQHTVLAAGSAADAAIAALHQLGFRLSLDQVSRLDCDFAKLRRQGFHFIKVSARTLISGMQQAFAPVAAEDFKDLLARHGVALVVERVEDEKTVVQLLEFNVGHGQGFLFGEPRPVRDVGEIYDPRAKELGPATATRSAPALARRLAS
jgi:cyclic-di-GMP phosphodiesterase TipF (flagellum assembly factor)